MSPIGRYALAPLATGVRLATLVGLAPAGLHPLLAATLGHEPTLSGWGAGAKDGASST